MLDPDSCVADMLITMESRTTRSVYHPFFSCAAGPSNSILSYSTQTRLARIRSTDSKFVDVQHLDHYTP